MKQLSWPPSIVKSNFQKLQAIIKIITKSEKKSTKIAPHYAQTTPHSSGFLAIKQPLAPILTGVVGKSYVNKEAYPFPPEQSKNAL